MDDIFDDLLEPEQKNPKEKLKDAIRALAINVNTDQWGQVQQSAIEILCIVSTKLLFDHAPEALEIFKNGNQHRFFDHQLFCGNGEVSSAQIGLLFLLLDRTIGNLAGTQQLTYHGPMFTTKKTTRQKEIKRLDTQRKTAIKDIRTALSGDV